MKRSLGFRCSEIVLMRQIFFESFFIFRMISYSECFHIQNAFIFRMLSYSECFYIPDVFRILKSESLRILAEFSDMTSQTKRKPDKNVIPISD